MSEAVSDVDEVMRADEELETPEAPSKAFGGEGSFSKASHSKKDFLTAGELFEVILRHPDWRVVEAGSSIDCCHPLEQVYKTDYMLFKYDGASRQMHHEGMCEDILDLYGTEPMGDAAYDHPVLIQEMYAEKWKGEDVHKIRKHSLDSSAKWIKLHPFD